MTNTISAGRKRLTLTLATLGAVGSFSIDLYLPALPTIARSLHSSMAAAQSSVTVFLAGFALGMLFYGPVSDRFGRRGLLLGGIGVYTLSSLACMLSGTMGQLIAARFLQALGGGAASILPRVIVKDIHEPLEAIRTLSVMSMATTLAPLLAPLIGSQVLLTFGWRGTFGALILWGLAGLALTWYRVPETLPAERRAGHSLGRAFAAYGELLRHPAAIGLLLAGGMALAAIFAYITGGPFYFIDLRGFSPFDYSLVFASNALGILAANFVNSRLVHRVGASTLAGWGCGIGFVAALLLMAAIRGHWALPPILLGFFLAVGAIGLLSANCVGLLMNRFPRNAGAAAALFGASQFGFGVLASALVNGLYDGSGVPMAEVILGTWALSSAGFLLYRSAQRDR